jgi:signal transduction histidine kinase
VYRDGFRIWPYGEPHDDWLRLDQRRVNNPVVKLSNNQVVGFIEIGADRNPDLRDQTNREGLIHNEAFTDLQRLTLHLLNMLEAERQARRHPEDALPGHGKPGPRKNTSEGDSIPESLERLARQTDGPIGNELRRTAERVRSRFEAQEQVHRRTLDGYSDLAALGHSASLFGRNINIGLSEMKQQMATLRTALERKRGVDPSALAGSVAELQDRMERLLGQLALVGSTGGGPTRRRRGLDVPVELERIRQNLLAMLENEDADLEVHAPEGMLLRTEMRPEVFTSLISVLIRNSTEWRQEGVRLQMIATIQEAEEDLEIIFSDNGQGVIPALEDKILEPGVSGNNGAGMGLTIARNIAAAHGGALSLVTDRRRKGATFRVRLPRKRSRATPGKG